MTPKGTPDDEHDGDRQDQAGPGRAPAPPPPGWLGQGTPPQGAHLLPEPAEQPPPFGEPLPEPEDDESDRTVSDIDISGTMRTQVFSPGDQAAGGAAGPAPLPAFPGAPGQGGAGQGGPGSGGPESGGGVGDQTILDASDWLGKTGSGADEDDEADVTRVERPGAPKPPAAQPPAPQYSAPLPPAAQPPAPQPPAPQPPAPFPYAQDVPGTPAAPAPEPFPWAQEIPGTPQAALPPTPQARPEPAAPVQPSAPEPFPWAQEIPDDKPNPPAPEPFPYAQEIPGAPPSPAPEPFPYAQEIPGASPAPEPFPYAQEIPGGAAALNPSAYPQEAAPPAPQPVSPPPPIDEPWRTTTGGGGKRGGGSGKKIVLGAVGGLVAAALVAGGVYAVFLRGDSGGDGGDGSAGGARLAGRLFAPDPGARADGRDQQLTGVAASGGTVVAVGGESDPDGGRGVFLVSTDGGRSFKAAAVQGTGGAGEVPDQVAGGPNGWVAIGSRPGGGAVWTSPDGRSWTREPDRAGDVFGGGSRVARVVATDKGFLAVGEHSRKGDFSDSVPAAWLSQDGRTWQALIGDQVGIPVRGTVVLDEAASYGGVILLESVHTPKPKKPSFRRVWTSSDGGRTWAPAKVPAPKDTHGLVIGGGKAGLLAVREAGSGKSAYGQAYTSTDGTHWKQGGKLQTSGYQRVERLLGTENGYVGVVVRGRDVLVSRSADGGSWQDAGTLPATAGRTLLGASATGQETVLVGRDPGNGDGDPLLAVRSANGTEVPVDASKIPGAFGSDQAVTSVAAQGGRVVAAGSTGGDAAIWTSADGASWARARFSGGVARPGLQRLSSVAAGGKGWVAVGDGGGPQRKPLVLASADGQLWEQADTAPAFAAAGRPLATYGAAAGPSGYVVVGEDGTSGAVWFSTDLRNWQRGGGVGRNDLTAAPKANRWLRAAAAGTFGFVAVGGVQDPSVRNGPSQRPAVWTSADGLKWKLQQLPLPAGVPGGWLTQVAAKGGTLVAQGNPGEGTQAAPLSYVSTDGGKTWRESALPGAGAQGPARVSAVAATPQGFTVTGTTGKAGSADVVTWTSANGTGWKAETPGGDVLAGTGTQEITGLAAFKSTLIGVGRSAGASGEQPVLWSRPDS